MTVEEKYAIFQEVKNHSKKKCPRVAREALMFCSWDKELAKKYVEEKEELGWDFSTEEFRRKHNVKNR